MNLRPYQQAAIDDLRRRFALKFQSVYSQLADLEQQHRCDKNELFLLQFTGRIDVYQYAKLLLMQAEEEHLLQIRKQQSYN